MPYLAKKPFSLAIIRGAESVRAINPNLALVVSTLAVLLIWVEELVPDPELSDEQPCATIAVAAVTPDVIRNFLREILLILTLFNSLLFVTVV
jgi:hypothetical protein